MVNAFDSLQAVACLANAAHQPRDSDPAIAPFLKYRLSMPTKHKLERELGALSALFATCSMSASLVGVVAPCANV